MEKSRQIVTGVFSLKVYSKRLTYRCCMNIYVNNKMQEIQGQPKIADALASLNIVSQKGIAIAINNNVVPKAEWDTYELQHDDKLTLIRATQGG
jgi:sulfur carrier protein